jgi:RND superfamily putative drug exporter
VAQFLYRVGALAERHAWRVVGAWTLILAVTVGAFFVFAGSFQSSFTIPGTETDRVTTQLREAAPDAAGTTGIVTFSRADGSPLTAAEESQIAWLLHRVESIDGVTGTVDPFAAQREREAREQQLADGAAQAADAKGQLEAAQAEIDAGQDKLDQAAELARATGTYGFLASRFEEQQAQLDDAQAKVDEGRDELARQSALLAQGVALFEAASEVRTVSADGSAALGLVTFGDDALDLPASVKQAVADELDDAAIPGVDVGYSSVIGSSVSGVLGVGELIGFAIAAIVLLVMLRALLPALVPLVNSILGVAVGVTGALALSDVVPMDTVTPVLGVMLGLAVGIDYALFILYRHRKQVLAGASIRESIPLANGTAGNAVVFAGATVIVALLALAVTGIPFLTVMGGVAAGCVLVAVLVSVTFTPALLSLMGQRVLNGRARKSIGHERHTAGVPRPMSTRRAVITGLAGTILLALVAIPALSMRLGLPDGSQEEPGTPQERAHSVIAEEFGPGVNGPLLIVAAVPTALTEDEVISAQVELARTIMRQPDVVAVAPVGVLDNGRILTFQVIPAEGPSTESTEAVVSGLRSASPLADGTVLGVAGQASGNIDISAKLAEALPIYLAVVVGLSMVILVLVFRSLLVPVVATGGFVLSLFAALGAMTAVYQWGWLGSVFGVHNPGPVLSFAPILIMGVLFGLAMDYQLFLVSGMREAYVHGQPARSAVVSGLTAGRAVVTAAAIIMVSVFGGFVFSHLGMVRPLGFGLAIGVLFDAFIVRMLLVPSAMHILGDKAWWLPRWLDRVLPNVDIEGAAIEREHSLHLETAERRLLTTGS